MSTLLSHLGFQTIAGIHVTDRQVHVAQLAATPIGPKLIQQFARVLTDDAPVEEQVSAVLSELGVSAVGVSLSTAECYLATRPIAAGGANTSPKILLRESMRSAASLADGMLAATANHRPGRRDLVTIAGCSRSFLTALAAESSQGPWRLEFAEPAPLSLMRRVSDRSKKPAIRVFLNRTQAITVLSCDGHVLLWNVVAIPPGQEGTLVLAQVRAMRSKAIASGIDLPADRAIVHGRSDLGALTDVPWIESELRMPFEWQSDPEASADEYALGAAYGVVELQQGNPVNLANDYRRKPKFREIFPWRELIAYAVIFLCMAGILRMRRREVLAASEALISASSETGKTITALNQEKKGLQVRIASAQKLVDSRVAWTACLRDVTNSLPASVVLSSISGEAGLGAKKGKSRGPERILVLKGSVTLPSGGLIPHEIDRLLDALRANPRLSALFGSIELADLKQFEQPESDGEFAMFTIVCVPKKKAIRA